jgi:hypothetical protein
MLPLNSIDRRMVIQSPLYIYIKIKEVLWQHLLLTVRIRNNNKGW